MESNRLIRSNVRPSVATIVIKSHNGSPLSFLSLKNLSCIFFSFLPCLDERVPPNSTNFRVDTEEGIFAERMWTRVLGDGSSFSTTGRQTQNRVNILVAPRADPEQEVARL